VSLVITYKYTMEAIHVSRLEMYTSFRCELLSLLYNVHRA